MTVTATFVLFTGQTVTSSPPGAVVLVDGAPCTTPCNYQWTTGSQHILSVASPQNPGTDSQVSFLHWPDGTSGSQDTITASAGTAYTATFGAQYYLTTSVSPANSGSISPASGWYTGGSNVQVSATAGSQAAFSGFSGALSGTANPQALTITGPAAVIANFVGVAVTTALLPVGVTQVAYSTALAAQGGNGSYTWSIVEGTLPSGLALASGTISGTPAATGTSTFTVEALDTSGLWGTAQLTLTINPVGRGIRGSLPAAVAGVPYSAPLTAVGGTPAYSWAWAGSQGKLPAGLTLSNGVVSGTPTAVGAYPVAVTATDSLSTPATRNYTVGVVSPGQMTARVASVLGCPSGTSLPNDGSSQVFTYCVGVYDASGNFSCGSPTGDAPNASYIQSINFSDSRVKIAPGSFRTPSSCSDLGGATFDIQVSAAGAPTGPYDLNIEYWDIYSDTMDAPIPLNIPDAVDVYDASPAITSVIPSTVYAGVPTDVTLYGNNLGSSGTVSVCTNSSGDCVAPNDGTTWTWSWSPDGGQIIVELSVPSAPLETNYYFQVGVDNDLSGNYFLGSGSNGNESQQSPGVAVQPVPAPPILQITSEGQPIPAGTCAHITVDPRMPSLAFTLSPSTTSPLTGWVNWQVSIAYTRGDGSVDQSTYGPSVQQATAAYTPAFQGLRGGSATVTWAYGPLPSFQSNFCIDANNPDASVIKPYVASQTPSYWALPKVIDDESSYQQFKPSPGPPNMACGSNGQSCGYGLTQLTSPAPSSDDLWNWHFNIVDGLLVFSGKQNVANTNWSGYVSAYTDWVQTHQSPAPPPDDPEGNCNSFSYAPTGSNHSFADAIALKMYNGQSQGDDYMKFVVTQVNGVQTASWVMSPTSNKGNYVAAVCRFPD